MTIDWARLAHTPLYGAAWGHRTPRTLTDAPPMPVWLWHRHIHADAGRSLLSPPAIWVLHAVPGDAPIWVALAPADIESGVASARAVFAAAGVLPQDTVLAVAPPAPWAGNMLPYLFSATDRLLPERTRAAAKVFPLSVTTVGYKADLAAFPLSMAPSVVAGSPDDIDALLQLTHTTGLEPRRFRLALLIGAEPVDPRYADLAESAVQLLFLPGLLAPAGGRVGAPGVVLPTDLVTAELIRDDEWGRSVQDPGRVPAVRAMASAVGDTGELVITVLNAALPIIRLRTALRIQVDEITPEGARVAFVIRPAPKPEAAGLRAFIAARPVRTRQNHRTGREA